MGIGAEKMHSKVASLEERLEELESVRRVRARHLKRGLGALGLVAAIGVLFGSGLAFSDPTSSLGCLDGSRYFCFTHSTPAKASQVNHNFAQVLEEAAPTGSVVAFAGPAGGVPPGWLLCNGSAVSRTTYGDLFTAIGVAHGQGDGGSTFNLPDYRGRFLRGVAHGSGNDPDRGTRAAPQAGGSSGDQVGSIQGDATALANNPFSAITAGAHTHAAYYNVGSDDMNFGGNSNRLSGADTSTVGSSSTTSSAGAHAHSLGGGDAETRPLNAYVNYIIKY